MSDVELVVDEDGTVTAMYSDANSYLLEDCTSVSIQRASHVEYETIDGRSGWTVRSALDPTLALRVVDWCRWCPAREGTIVTFQSREAALEEERRFFWQLIGKEELDGDQVGYERCFY